MFKVVYIDRNVIDKRYPNTLSDGDKFFTMGFGSLHSRWFKKINPDIDVECWKADSRIKKIIVKEIEGVKFIMFPSAQIEKLGHLSFGMIRELRRRIKIKENIIINLSSIRNLLFYSIAFSMKNIPFIIQHHGETTAYYKYKINKGLKKIFYLLQIPIEYVTMKNIDIFYALDKDIQNYFIGKLKNIPIKIRPTGVNENIFNPINKNEAKKILGLDINKKYLLYVGRLNNTKHPDILIEAYKEIKKERNDLELILAGHEKSDPLYNYAKESGAILYGVILQTELYKYLSAADIYILAKLDEAIPFGGIGELSVQALYCETPIAGSTVKCFPEENRDKVGIIANDKETLIKAIKEILDSDGRYINLREKAIDFYSWKRICQKTEEDYSILAKKYYVH